MLQAQEESRALLMFQTLDRHVAGRVDSSAGAHDLYVQSRERMQDWMSIPGNVTLFNAQLNPAQLAVLSWITSMFFLTRAASKYAARTRLVDFDEFLSTPREYLSDYSAFLELGLSAEQLQAQWESVSGQYSKMPGRSFSTQDRNDRIRAAMEKHGEVVQRALGFAEQLIERVPALEPVMPYLR
ncbi:MAG: hypothetical protein R3308_07780, partial [Thiohalobacterales bacterium]|nr:hypothetical protein [Thiohalobacterales bacterium]